MVVSSVKRIAMGVQRSSALREWSVWMYQLLVWGQCVECVQMGTLEMERSALVRMTHIMPTEINSSCCPVQHMMQILTNVQ